LRAQSNTPKKAKVDLKYLIRAGLGVPDYWHPRLKMQPDFLSGKICRYPVSMDVKADYPGPLNDDGIPVVFLSGAPCVLPVTVALYGLGSHDAFVASGDQRYYRQMICALRWFENHPVSLGEGVGWPNAQDLPVLGLKAPWFSGLTQGLALSLFLRAYLMDGETRWSTLVRKAWLGYHVPVEHGGFCRAFGDGVIYEEYPGSELDCVFNGMCHALIGLWECWRSGVVPEAEREFDRGVIGLRSCLPRFVYGRWSLYSLSRCSGKPLLASPYYQRSNGLLAQIIGMMAQESEFCVYGKRWQKSSESKIRRLGLSIRVAFDRYFYAPDLLNSDKARRN
jgi:hypothetical protein